MRIPIYYPESNHNANWMIIELQGELECNQTVADSLVVGKFTFHSSGDSAELIIGDHKLHGSIVSLKKPFAILQKRTDLDGNTCYDIAACVEKKYLFNKRPQSLLNSNS